MALTVASSGTQNCTIDTDHTLYAPTSAGVYMLMLDLCNMAASDTLEVRIEAKVLTGGTKRIFYIATFAGVQGDPIKLSPPFSLPWGGDFIIRQIDAAGSPAGSAVDWSVMTV